MYKRQACNGPREIEVQDRIGQMAPPPALQFLVAVHVDLRPPPMLPAPTRGERLGLMSVRACDGVAPAEKLRPGRKASSDRRTRAQSNMVERLGIPEQLGVRNVEIVIALW